MRGKLILLTLVLTLAGTLRLPVARVAAVIPSYDHIFLVIDENHSRNKIIGPAPYLTSLAKGNAQSSNYYAIGHPSLPNYLALTSGSTQGVTNDGTGYVFNVTNIADEVSQSGRSWKSYMEDLPSPCNNTSHSGLYAKKHDPFMYYSGILNVASECNRVVPYSQLASDLSSESTTPNYVWITPNLCDDMHGCPVATGDAWAAAHFPAIFSSPAWISQKCLFLFTFDEAGIKNNVAMFAISSDGSTKTGYTSTVYATHYSLLKTIETAWGLEPTGAGDAAATPMADLFAGVNNPSPSPTVPDSPSPNPSSSP